MNRHLFHILLVISLSVAHFGMAKFSSHYTGGTGPRYFLPLLKHEAEVYKRSYLMYPSSIKTLEEDMKNKYGGNIEFFNKAKGAKHTYEIVESSPNFFRARSFNEQKYPDYEITSTNRVPHLIQE